MPWHGRQMGMPGIDVSDVTQTCQDVLTWRYHRAVITVAGDCVPTISHSAPRRLAACRRRPWRSCRTDITCPFAVQGARLWAGSRIQAEANTAGRPACV